MTTTHWKCEKCGRTGRVLHDDHESVYGAIEALRRSHAGSSPECETDLTRIRVSSTSLPDQGQEPPAAGGAEA